MIKEAIGALASGSSLDVEEAAAVMGEIMDGQVSPSQLGAFLVALKMKGETVDEIAGLARTMKARAMPVKVTGLVVDVVGTGGDQAGTFNISTTTALAVAAAGLTVAKHGNRAASSRCGSADVLEALGVKIDLTAEGITGCLERAGIAFMFAPVFHPAMKYASATRREIGIPTIFNVLGPLTNPACARAMLLGVAREELAEKMAEALCQLGVRHALVVHGSDGLDEITITGPSHLCELKGGLVKQYTFRPEDFGMKRAAADSLRGGTAEVNAAILRSVLSRETGPRRDVVLLNTAAALLAGDRVSSIIDGLALAREVIDSGRALSKLEELIRVSRSLSHDS